MFEIQFTSLCIKEKQVVLSVKGLVFNFGVQGSNPTISRPLNPPRPTKKNTTPKGIGVTPPYSLFPRII